MYHLELRQFPHNACHFNLSDGELQTIIAPWVGEQWVEVGERKWNPHQAKLRVIEGPEIPLDKLTMGRGWRLAEREGTDVTRRVLEAARAQAEAAARAASAAAVAARAPSADHGDVAGAAEVAQPALADSDGHAGEQDLLADSLGLELLGLLDEEPLPLSRAWQLAEARLPEHRASESLALAEQAVMSLLDRRLIVVDAIGAAAGGGGVGRGDVADKLPEHGGGATPGNARLALRRTEGWRAASEAGALVMRRA